MEAFIGVFPFSYKPRLHLSFPLTPLITTNRTEWKLQNEYMEDTYLSIHYYNSLFIKPELLCNILLIICGLESSF